KPPRISISFQDEDIRNVIQSIAMQANANIVIAPDVNGLVTMKMEDRPWRVVLDAVCKTLGFHVVEEDHLVLRIVTGAALIEQLETRVIELRYLRPRATYVAHIKTDFAIGEPKAPTNDPNVDFPLLGALRKHLSPNGELDYFDRQNAIFVKDTKPVLDRIEEVVTRLDVEPAEIFIDVKFVTTSESNGVDLAFGAEQLTATFNGAAIPSKVPFNLGPGGFDDDIFPSSTDDFANFAEGPFGGAFVDDLILKTGLLDFRNVRLAVRLNQNSNSVDVVQAPKLITLDHQEATVFVGDLIRYAESSAATNQAGGLAFAIQEAENSPVETGFQLLIIPHVVPGTNKILMTVIPQAKFLSGTSDPNLEGFNLFTSGESSISLPQITSQTVVTNMMLESGQTGVIGGLVSDRVSKITNKIPWLGDLPYIGFFFRRTQDSELHSNLLVFLTPTIIRGSKQSQESLDELLAQSNSRTQEEWEEIIQNLELADEATNAQN
ncbi:MAG: secretin N-terminal domain-containing protein, partial [Planctomycetota bacterium JB042]